MPTAVSLEWFLLDCIAKLVAFICMWISMGASIFTTFGLIFIHPDGVYFATGAILASIAGLLAAAAHQVQRAAARMWQQPWVDEATRQTATSGGAVLLSLCFAFLVSLVL